MELKPSSLAGPLWVVGVGLAILGMGVGFMAYVLWEKRVEATRPPAKAPPTPEELRATVYSNRPLPLAKKAAVPPPPIIHYVTNIAARATNTNPPAPPSDTSAVVDAVQLATPGPRWGGGGGPVVQPFTGVFGRVTLLGTPPRENSIKITDPNCGKAGTPPTQTRFYVVSKDGGLADAFVYIRSGIRDIYAFHRWPRTVINQVGCEYTPYVLGIETGQPVIVRNSDRTLHNVHFTPAVVGNQEKNQAQRSGGADLTFFWPKPEVFLRLKCDVHPWMFAYLGVVDHSFFAVSDTNGFYVLSNTPPPGKYVLEAVHRKTHGGGGNGVQREIEVKRGENLRVDFEVELEAGASR